MKDVKYDKLSTVFIMLGLFTPGALAQSTGPDGVLGGGVDTLPLPDFGEDEDPVPLPLPPAEDLLGTDAPVTANGPSIRIDNIIVRGATVPELVDIVGEVRTQQLHAASEREKLWSAADIIRLRNAFTQGFVTAGYINSGAIIPDQDISTGVLTIDIIEGTLAELPVRMVTPSIFGATRLRSEIDSDQDAPIRLPGNYASERRGEDSNGDGAITLAEQEDIGWRPLQLRRSYIEKRLRPRDGEVLNQKKLQERFQRLASDPAIRKIEAALAPGAAPGEARLFVDVKEAKPVDLYVTAASERSPSIGGERVAIGTNIRNLLGFGDVLTAQVGLTEGLQDAAVSYNLPLGNTRFALNVHGDISEAEIVEEPLTNLNVLSDSNSYGIGVTADVLQGVWTRCSERAEDGSCPAGRSTSTLYDLTLGIDVSRKQTETELLNIPFSFSPGSVDGQTDNTVITVSADGVLQSPRQVAAARLAVTTGIDAIEIDAPGNPPEDFLSVRAQGQYARRLFRDLDHQLIARIDAQYSPTTLITAERISFGGIDSVRGFRKNEVLTDNAVVGSLEYRVGLKPLFNNLPTRTFDNWSASVFVDAGHGWNSDFPDPEFNTLISAGLQLNFDIFERVSGSVYYGQRLINLPDPVDDQFQDTGVGFRLTFRGL